MPQSSSYRAFLRAKKALANGNTSFKPRGEKNKAAFQALGKHDAQTHISVSDESPPPKKIKITTASSSSSSSPQNSDLASLLDFNLENISNTSDEEEEEEKVEQTAAMLAKIKTRREQIKKREENMKTELSKTPSKPWAFRLPPKTEAQLRMEKEEDAKRERMALEYSTPADTDSEDETDVDEPPPCPVHLMR